MKQYGIFLLLCVQLMQAMEFAQLDPGPRQFSAEEVECVNQMMRKIAHYQGLIRQLQEDIQAKCLTIRRMRFIFFMMAIGFCYGVGKKIIENLHRDKNVRKKNPQLLYKKRKSRNAQKQCLRSAS